MTETSPSFVFAAELDVDATVAVGGVVVAVVGVVVVAVVDVVVDDVVDVDVDVAAAAR